MPLRPVLDLRPLNRYILSKSFHMVTLQDVILLLQQGDFMSALDPKDTYLHITIHPTHRRYLRFIINSHQYQFNVLPFRVTTAPRVFTKCFAIVAAHLRRQIIHVFPYLDNLFIKTATCQQCYQPTQVNISLFHNLGFTINALKSTSNLFRSNLTSEQSSSIKWEYLTWILPGYNHSRHLILIFNQVNRYQSEQLCVSSIGWLMYNQSTSCQTKHAVHQWTQAEGQWEDLVLVSHQACHSM